MIAIEKDFFKSEKEEKRLKILFRKSKDNFEFDHFMIDMD